MDLNAGAMFLLGLNLALILAGAALAWRAATRSVGLLLLAGGLACTALLVVAVTRLSAMLLGQPLIDASLQLALAARPFLLLDAGIVLLLLAAWRLRARAPAWAVALAGASVLAFLALALGPWEQPASTPAPVLLPAAIGWLAFGAAAQRRWTAAVPLVLSIGVLAALVVSTAAQREAAARLEAPAREPAAVAPGFRLNVYAQLAEQPSALAVDAAGRLYVTTLAGNVLRLTDGDGDGQAEQPVQFAGGLGRPLGIAWHAGSVYISTAQADQSFTGRIVRAQDLDSDGRADQLDDLVTGLPGTFLNLHQNNDLAVGPDGRLYVGIGSTTDHSPETVEWAATISSLNLDGSDMRVTATGVRNPYGLAFSPDGQLFATDNGPNYMDDNLQFVPPEELNLIIEGGDYGFPRYYGAVPPDSAVISPVMEFLKSSVPAGLAVYGGSQFPAEYRGNVFVALWARGIDNADPRYSHPRFGQRVARVALAPPGSGRPAVDHDFVTGLISPIDVAEGRQGELFVADMGNSRIYRVTYQPP